MGVMRTLRAHGEQHRAQELKDVYFLLAERAGALKIGHAQDAAHRVIELQVASPEPLVLIGTLPGGPALEKRLHEQFRAERLRGEWFRATAEVLATVRRLLATE